MQVIGLTGGIGAGKSLVEEVLGGLGARVIDADKVGHEAYAPGTEGFRAVVEAFGTEVVGGDGQIDRARLGEKVFGNAAELQKLTAIVHPLIRQMVDDRITAARQDPEVRVVVLEAAILLDSGWDAVTDEVWVVVADRSAIRQRLAAARGLSESEVDARAAKQMSDEKRRSRADVLVQNFGTPDELRSEVERLWRQRIAVGTVSG
jgi:dephospho-CoA kinase